MTERFEEAVESYQAGIAMQRDGGPGGSEFPAQLATPYMELGDLYYDAGDYQGALDAYETVGRVGSGSGTPKLTHPISEY
jgi:tetratricopeptide (TPR) repeat protein